MKPQNIKKIYPNNSEHGFSFAEIPIVLAIITIVSLASFELFRVNSNASNSISAKLEAESMMSSFTAKLKFKNMPAMSLTTDPLPPATLDPLDPPNPPTTPISKIVFSLLTISGATIENSYQTVCRPVTDSWYDGESQVNLKKLRDKIASICGSLNPCPSNDDLPWIKIVEQKTSTSTITSWAPPTASKPKSYGLHAVGLCIGWRPEGDGTFDIKAVGGYLNQQKEPIVAVSSYTISNSILGTGSIRMVMP